MPEPTDELRELLTYHLEGTRLGEPNPFTEEGQAVHHLTGVLRAWGRGDATLEELRSEFRHYGPKFDINDFLARKVEEGAYHSSALS